MTGNTRPYLRIATEEAFAPVEMLELYRARLAAGDIDDIGFTGLMGYFLTSPHPQPRRVAERLADLGEQRVADMDAAGVDHQVLALTAPGTQVLDAAEGERIAALANDRAAEAVARHPSRFSALAAVSFERPQTAVRELERAVTGLGLKGLILNSHVRGRYIDEIDFDPIAEALTSLDVPLYLHPTTPPNRMIGPLRDAGLDGAVFGFGVETGFHLLRIITSGLLDRHPDLRIVVGHLGEALPFWMHRIDHMHAKQVAAGRYKATGPLAQRPSEYLRRNVWFTTSGMPWPDQIMFVRQVMGPDRVMYAMDYPYQYDAEEVAMQDALPISAEEKADFFENIPRRVFGLTF